MNPDRLGPASRFAAWGRGPALLAVVGLIAALSIALSPVSPGSIAAPKVRASVEQQSDLDLYRAVIARVAAGESYYPAAAEELRRGGYPLKPFVTFRLPTQAYAYATFGEPVMIGLQLLLALGVVAAWYRRLRDHPLWQRALAMFLLAAGLGGLVEPVTGLFHESWAAMLMALGIALRRPGHAAAAVVAGGAALLVRETALPFVLAMAGLALLDKRWKEAAGWAAALGLFAGYLAFHAAQVAAVVTPADPASPGWSGLLGPAFALKAMAAVTAALILPYWLAAGALIVSLFGWWSASGGAALRAAILVTGYATMLALFARADTFYWALLAAPLSLAGVAFAPRAFADLAASLRGVRQSAP